MKEKSIVLSKREVMNALADRKVQKRMPVKHQPPSGEYVLATCLSTTGSKSVIGKHQWLKLDGFRVIDGKQPYFSCPWKNGDRLWVRESWADTNGESGPMISYRAGGDRFLVCESHPVDYSRYKGCNFTMWAGDLRRGEHGHQWRPAITMPHWASRVTLSVVNIGLEMGSPVVWVVELEVDNMPATELRG